MMDFLEQRLFEHISNFSTAPFLFIGSGMSRRYIDLENWEGLLRKFCGISGQNYEYLRSSEGGDLIKIASNLANKFHEFWWNSELFDANKKKYSSYTTEKQSALKIEIADYILGASDRKPASPELKEEIELLSQVIIDGIITTNYDKFLEEIFADFKVYIGQDQLIFSSPKEIGEIYKIHGCCTQPNSLVLTEADYQNFHERNPYLTAKLLTVFTEHPIIFLGYSLSDPNIQNIIKSIASCLTSSNISKLRDRMVFVQWDPEIEEGSYSHDSLILDKFNIPIISIKIPNYLFVYKALSRNKRKFPARLLRQLKECVYDLVLSDDEHNRMYVQDMDTDADSTGLEVVFGVGAIAKVTEKGYKGITREDILCEILDGQVGQTKYESKVIVEKVLPDLLKGATYVPVFKYLRLGGYLNDNGLLKTMAGLHPKIISAATVQINNFFPPAQYMKRQSKLPDNTAKLIEYFNDTEPREVLKYLAMINEEVLDADLIHDFLVKHRSYLGAGNSFDSTQYIKLICLFDFLKYKKMKNVSQATTVSNPAKPIKASRPSQTK